MNVPISFGLPINDLRFQSAYAVSLAAGSVALWIFCCQHCCQAANPLFIENLYLDLHLKISAAFRAFIYCCDPVNRFVVGKFIDFATAFGMNAAAKLDIVFSVVVRQS
jgi:hypothetical protein